MHSYLCSVALSGTVSWAVNTGCSAASGTEVLTFCDFSRRAPAPLSLLTAEVPQGPLTLQRFQLLPVGMELALTAHAALLSREVQLHHELKVFNTHSCKLQKAAMEDVNPADDPNNQGEDEFEEAEQEREENLPDENEKHKETGQKQGHPGMEEHLVVGKGKRGTCGAPSGG